MEKSEALKERNKEINKFRKRNEKRKKERTKKERTKDIHTCRKQERMNN